MAVGAPVVCSPVGMNTEIVTDGVEGFWASTIDEWVDKLDTLISDAELRSVVGERGRAKVAEFYSLAANAPLLVKALREQ